MKKELSPTHEMVACDVCGRTILKGERTEPYLVPDGSRRLVCELCTRRAEGAGWLRESAHRDLPAALPRAEPRRPLLARLRRLWGENGPPAKEAGEAEVGDSDDAGEWRSEEHREPAHEESSAPDGATAYEADEPLAEPEPREFEPEAPLEEPEPAPPAEKAADGRRGRRDRRSRRRLRDPRHVRAVPTNDDVKVERALEIFNASEHRRTVGGLVRTLGQPWVTALPQLDSTSEVAVIVAWELSWYQYRIDLGDSDEAVALVDKGHEIDQIDDALRRWNAAAAPDGALETGASEA